MIGVNDEGERLYPSYANFKVEVRKQFWKDADTQIKHAQWEKLRQMTYQDGDQFFQKFKELVYDVGYVTTSRWCSPRSRKPPMKPARTLYMWLMVRCQPPTKSGRHVYSVWTITTISRRWKKLQLNKFTPDCKHRR